MDRQIVVFLLAGQQYGMDIGQVYEIIRWEKPVCLPAMPTHLEGVIHLRERVIPVVDLAARLGLSPGGHGGSEQAAAQASGRIVIVDAGGAVVGLRVDAVQEVRVLPAGSVQPPPVQAGVDRYVEGVALAGDQLIIMLDVGQLFSRGEAALLALAGRTADGEVAGVVQ